MVSCSASNFTSPFPFRVLLVDDDGIHLSTVQQILFIFGYEVVKFNSPEAALAALHGNKHEIDIVVCGVQMTNVHGLRIIQTAGLDFDIPVVLMTSDSSHEVAIRGILNGACECVAKPIQPENLKLIWQYVVGKRRNEFPYFCLARIQGSVSISSGRVSPEIVGSPANEVGRELGAAAAARGGGPSCSNPKDLKKRQEEGGEGSSDHQDTTPKKPRLIWTDELHQIFVDAVNSLTFERVVPTKILEYMRNRGVSNISRENVASHLQKYRLYLRKSENNEADNSSRLRSQSVSLNVTNESSSIQSSPTDQTYSIQKNSFSTAHLPLQNLTQLEALPNQPIEVLFPPDETLFLDQNMSQPKDVVTQQELSIAYGNNGWDIHEGMLTAFQNSAPMGIWGSINQVLESQDIAISAMEPPQPQLEPLGQAINEENIFSLDFSHVNELPPPILSNQFFNNDGNISIVPPIQSNSVDLSTDLADKHLHINILKDYEETYRSQNFERLLEDYKMKNM